MLISVEELAQKITDEKMLIIDARSWSEYAKGHIPGALSLDLFSFHWVDSSPSGIEAFTKHTRLIFSMLGVDESKQVVVYDNTSGMLAVRGVWLLQYLSHPNTRMLDGGLGAWSRSKELETKTNASVPSELRTPENPTLIVGYGDILGGGGSLELIDSRSAEEYSGKLVRSARGGHIQGAQNIDANTTINKDGTLFSKEELAKIYDLPRDARIVTYCQGAYRAAHAYVSLKILGYEDVRVYLGSWGEWANRPELPIKS